MAERLEKVHGAIAREPLTAFEVIPRIYTRSSPPTRGPWLLSETLAMLTHIEALGGAERLVGEPERWRAAGHDTA